jgi:hypothetical protein
MTCSEAVEIEAILADSRVCVIEKRSGKSCAGSYCYADDEPLIAPEVDCCRRSDRVLLQNGSSRSSQRYGDGVGVDVAGARTE